MRRPVRDSQSSSVQTAAFLDSRITTTEDNRLPGQLRSELPTSRISLELEIHPMKRRQQAFAVSSHTTMCLVIVAMLSIGGCDAATPRKTQEPDPTTGSHAPKVVKHFVVLDRIPPCMIRILLRDKEVGRADFTEERIGSPTSIQVSESLEDHWGTNDVSVVASTPSGWNSFLQSTDRPRIKPETPDCVFYEAKARRINFCTIWVDNRDNPIVKVECGQVLREIPAGDALKLEVPVPEAPTALTMDGRVIGMLTDASAQKSFVLDSSGKHTYTLRTAFYGGAQFQEDVGHGAFKQATTPRILKGSHLYEINGLDLFLKHAPESVQGSQQSMQKRTVLTDSEPQKDSK